MSQSTAFTESRSRVSNRASMVALAQVSVSGSKPGLYQDKTMKINNGPSRASPSAIIIATQTAMAIEAGMPNEPESG